MKLGEIIDDNGQSIGFLSSDLSNFSGTVLQNFQLIAFAIIAALDNSKEGARDITETFDQLVNTTQTLKDVLSPDEFAKFTFLDNLIKKLDPTKLKVEDFQENMGKLIKDTLDAAVEAELALEMITNPSLFGTRMFPNTDREFFKAFDGVEAQRRAEILKEMLGGFANSVSYTHLTLTPTPYV